MFFCATGASAFGRETMTSIISHGQRIYRMSLILRRQHKITGLSARQVPRVMQSASPSQTLHWPSDCLRESSRTMLVRH